VLSFLLESITRTTSGPIPRARGVAIRQGINCAAVMQRFGIAAHGGAASFALLQYQEEVDALVEGIRRVREVFLLMLICRELYQE